MRDFGKFFRMPQLPSHRQYEALRAFYLEGQPAADVAQRFGYTYHGFNSLRRDFARDFRAERFFLVRERRPWSQRLGRAARLRSRIVELRKQFWSVYDIALRLRRDNTPLDVTAIHRVLRAEGFGKLPRRIEEERRRCGPGRKGDR